MLFNTITFYWTDFIDIVVLFLIIYNLILLLQGTRSFQILLGLLVLLSLYYAAQILKLNSILWVYQNLLQYIVVLLVIIFQADIRNALANFGKTGFFRKNVEYARYIERIIKTINFIRQQKQGLIIAFERKISLGEYSKTGVDIQAITTSTLLSSIFSKKSPLHDGAVIIDSKFSIVAASCIFPLSPRIDLEFSYGTRHRAAIGLTELTDALVLVVSEETGKISLFVEGVVKRNINIKKTRELLKKYLKNGN